MKAKYLTFVLLLLLSLGLDQGTKIWARKTLKPIAPASQVVIKGIWEHRYSENPGSAFGFFRNLGGARWALFGVGVLCLGVIGLWLHKTPGAAPWLGAKLGLLAGGAIGNMIDRAMYSRVTDFIVWKYTTSTRIYEWYTFNVADAALVIGVALILIDRPRDPEEPAPGDATKAPLPGKGEGSAASATA